MDILRKIGTEIHCFDSSKQAAFLKEKMQDVFDSKDSPIFGKFNHNLEFEAWRANEIGWISRPGGPLPLVYLKGELIPDGNKSKVLIQLIPYRAWIPAILSIIIGILGVFQYTEIGNTPILIISLLMVPIVPLVMYWIVVGQKRRLTKTFGELIDFRGY